MFSKCFIPQQYANGGDTSTQSPGMFANMIIKMTNTVIIAFHSGVCVKQSSTQSN